MTRYAVRTCGRKQRPIFNVVLASLLGASSRKPCHHSLRAGFNPGKASNHLHS